MKKNKKNKGFTLFELLISISIIGILTALASVAFSGAQRKARDARRVQDIKLIQTAAEQYYSQSATYSYPPSSGAWVSGTGITILAAFPVDPKSNSPYSYSYNGGNNSYVVYAQLEDERNGNALTNTCNIGTTGLYFCAKNQQ